MEYIFGTVQRLGRTIDILKTVGNEHTDLKDKHTIVRKYPDCTITDTFIIVKKFLSKEDPEKNCYDWYEIDQHYRNTDYFSPQKEKIEADIAEVQNALIDLDESRLQSEADIENALIEIDTALAELEDAIYNMKEG